MKRDELIRRAREARDIREELVEVPEWGMVGKDAVLVRGLSGVMRDEFEKSCLVRTGRNKAEFSAVNMRAKLVVRCVVDDEGNRVFSESDEEWLGNKSASALGRIFDVAARLSAISKEDAEELGKNSESDQSAVSSSVSH